MRTELDEVDLFAHETITGLSTAKGFTASVYAPTDSPGGPSTGRR